MIIERDCFGIEIFVTFIDIQLDPEMGKEGVVGFQNQLDGNGTHCFFETLIF